MWIYTDTDVWDYCRCVEMTVVCFSGNLWESNFRLVTTSVRWPTGHHLTETQNILCFVYCDYLEQPVMEFVITVKIHMHQTCHHRHCRPDQLLYFWFLFNLPVLLDISTRLGTHVGDGSVRHFQLWSETGNGLSYSFGDEPPYQSKWTY